MNTCHRDSLSVCVASRWCAAGLLRCVAHLVELGLRALRQEQTTRRLGLRNHAADQDAIEERKQGARLATAVGRRRGRCGAPESIRAQEANGRTDGSANKQGIRGAAFTTRGVSICHTSCTPVVSLLRAAASILQSTERRRPRVADVGWLPPMEEKRSGTGVTQTTREGIFSLIADHVCTVCVMRVQCAPVTAPLPSLPVAARDPPSRTVEVRRCTGMARDHTTAHGTQATDTTVVRTHGEQWLACVLPSCSSWCLVGRRAVCCVGRCVALLAGPADCTRPIGRSEHGTIADRKGRRRTHDTHTHTHRQYTMMRFTRITRTVVPAACSRHLSSVASTHWLSTAATRHVVRQESSAIKPHTLPVGARPASHKRSIPPTTTRRLHAVADRADAASSAPSSWVDTRASKPDLSFTHRRAVKSNIVLLGAPGSGKSSIGRVLSRSLGLPLIDIDDDHLEPLWRTTVAKKLAELGDEGFLDTEGEALMNLQATNSVIALSGYETEHIRDERKAAL